MSQFKFERNGKQILCNGSHVLDSVNEAWASVLTVMLNRDANRMGDKEIDREFERGVS
jgi:hypothetical protein